MQKGFTLIEILIVITIIGILASLAMLQYQISIAKTQFNRTLYESANLKIIVDTCLASGQESIGLLSHECHVPTIPSNYLIGESQDGSVIPNNMGTPQVSTSLINPTITSTFKSTSNIYLKNQKLVWEKQNDGTWICKTNINAKVIPPACSFTDSI